jgi:hypothetical protein
VYFINCLEGTLGERRYSSTFSLVEVCDTWMKQLRADMQTEEGCGLPNTTMQNSTRGRRNTVKPGRRISDQQCGKKEGLEF